MATRLSGATWCLVLASGRLHGELFGEEEEFSFECVVVSALRGQLKSSQLEMSQAGL